MSSNNVLNLTKDEFELFTSVAEKIIIIHDCKISENKLVLNRLTQNFCSDLGMDFVLCNAHCSRF